MNKKSLFRLLLVVLIIAVGVVAYFSSNKPVQVEADNSQIPLEKPTFMEDVNESNSSMNQIASVLDQEAGISAYTQVSGPIDLSEVRSLYHTIEIETADYILGSITPPDNWDSYDVHVYVHKDGWMLAYYLRDEPAVKVFDWQTYSGTMNPTRFQSVLNSVATALSLPDPTLTYYDFRYPNATNLLLVVEHVSSHNTTESFDILDTSFTYYERSWGLGGDYDWDNDNSYYKVDDTTIHSTTIGDRTHFDTGFLSSSQLPPGDPHTIYIHNDDVGLLRGALAIVYGS